jgi:phosphotransferase system HPr (HPr) family protein
MTEATVVVTHEVGLHARPAATFVKTAKGFAAKIEIINVTRGTDPADAKSLIQVFKAAVARDHEIRIVASGEDAEEAVAALVELIETNFGE